MAQRLIPRGRQGVRHGETAATSRPQTQRRAGGPARDPAALALGLIAFLVLWAVAFMAATAAIADAALAILAAIAAAIAALLAIFS